MPFAGVPARSRGQTEAPIELFVAVIILAMSMALALTVINQSNEAKCLAELKGKTRELQNAMVDVALASPPTAREVFLTLPTCPGKDFIGLRIARYTDPAFCAACPGRYGGCWKIEPLFEQDGRIVASSEATSCVDISGGVGIEDESSPSPDTGLNRAGACVLLSQSACPPRQGDPEGRDCRAEVRCAAAGFEGDAVCRTLGDRDGRAYAVRLTKRLYLGGSGAGAGEQAFIGVCALTPQRLQG